MNLFLSIQIAIPFGFYSSIWWPCANRGYINHMIGSAFQYLLIHLGVLGTSQGIFRKNVNTSSFSEKVGKRVQADDPLIHGCWIRRRDNSRAQRGFFWGHWTFLYVLPGLPEGSVAALGWPSAEDVCVSVDLEVVNQLFSHVWDHVAVKDEDTNPLGESGLINASQQQCQNKVLATTLREISIIPEYEYTGIFP